MSATTNDVPGVAGSGDGGARRAAPRAAVQVPPPDKVAATRQSGPSNWAMKATMAVTGVLLSVFIALHLFGNLKVYTGPEHFDAYAEWLRTILVPFLPPGTVVWAQRIVLGVALILHVTFSVIIRARGRRARGPYAARKTDFRSRSAALQMITGVLILAFVIFHLLDLTFGWQPFATSSYLAPSATGHSAYDNLINSLQRPWSAAIYGLMMLAVALHVAHGASTLASDLGAMGKRLRALATALGGLLALAVLLGNASIPIAVQMGWLS